MSFEKLKEELIDSQIKIGIKYQKIIKDNKIN